MGVFKIPKNILQELDNIMQKFWWGQKAEERRIHWCSWKKMGKGKTSGGLGFRNFESFNLAMLAKKGWRLLQNPNSLAAQVLSAKYFPNGVFLKAKLGRKPSFIWRSILAAKPLLEEGLVWRLGNDQSIKIWQDKWLPTPSSYRVQSGINILGVEARVAKLIDRDTKA
ncbi:uncharacterized mitochondrial protein AtMg00310-like [Carya illinoinensis]|uniref:uncharacterized mitochondrial protein AtMg00310-like n=1 Tax=Carya illinoinensis TaxID=32201 RepID=UPI001C725C4E|nr:uncharacterized mitochondrial protein AtMg00310-like [Carya illinoinensis]